MTQVGNSTIFSNQDSITYRSVFDPKNPEITTLVHFSAACEAVPFQNKLNLTHFAAMLCVLIDFVVGA